MRHLVPTHTGGWGSLTLYSSINKFYFWRTCIKNNSQIFILPTLLQSFNRSMLCFMFPYSFFYLICAVCKLKQGCLFLCTYLVCSLCLIPNDLPGCPTWTFSSTFHRLFNVYLTTMSTDYSMDIQQHCQQTIQWTYNNTVHRLFNGYLTMLSRDHSIDI
jgi:hypothetical protein